MKTERNDDNIAIVVFPHQLFKKHPGFKKSRNVIFVEEQLFFSDYHYRARFHKKRLILHRASMKAWSKELQKKGYRVHYIEFVNDSHMKYLFDVVRKRKFKRLYVADIVDFILSKRLLDNCEKEGVELRQNDD